MDGGHLALFRTPKILYSFEGTSILGGARFPPCTVGKWKMETAIRGSEFKVLGLVFRALKHDSEKPGAFLKGHIEVLEDSNSKERGFGVIGNSCTCASF